MKPPSLVEAVVIGFVLGILIVAAYLSTKVFL